MAGFINVYHVFIHFNSNLHQSFMFIHFWGVVFSKFKATSPCSPQCGHSSSPSWGEFPAVVNHGLTPCKSAWTIIKEDSFDMFWLRNKMRYGDTNLKPASWTCAKTLCRWSHPRRLAIPLLYLNMCAREHECGPTDFSGKQASSWWSIWAPKWNHPSDPICSSAALLGRAKGGTAWVWGFIKCNLARMKEQMSVPPNYCKCLLVADPTTSWFTDVHRLSMDVKACPTTNI